MAQRGFFAEIQHQTKLAARERARQERQADKAHAAAIRKAERVRLAEKRALAALARSTQAEHKRRAKEAREAHIATMNAEVEKRNLLLLQTYDETDSLLDATLSVDDYVDLETLRTAAEHPPFHRADLETPIPPPSPILDPTKPTFVPVPPLKGLQALIGKKKHAKAIAEASDAHNRAVDTWRAELIRIESDRKTAASEHAAMEALRVSKLEAARSQYEAECSARETKATEHNKAVDELIANLGYGTTDAVQDYLSIVLSNSVYPDHFLVQFSFVFEAETAELRLQVIVPSPDKLPIIKAYKYTRSSDEITTTSLSQKACKDRYAGAVNQVALRSLHEVFEADRRGIVQTISLDVGAEATDPATGKEIYVPFIAVGAERASFLELNLSNVVPAATLSHLGAVVSKNPFGLVAVDASGIRQT